MLPYAAWLSWLIPLIGSLLVPAAFRVGKRVGEGYAVALPAIGAIYSFSMIQDVWGGRASEERLPWIPLTQGRFLEAGVRVDPLSVLMASIATSIGTLVLIYSIEYMSHYHSEYSLARYYFFMTFFIGGMTELVMANNFLQLYVGWEIVGLCSYALIGFYYRKEQAAHAGIKAFVVTRAGDVALLIGIILLYTNVGSFNFGEISAGLRSGLETGTLSKAFVLLSLLLILGGAIGKSAQMPLDVWLPDAMEGPTPVSSYIHGASMVKAGVYLVARTVFSVVPLGLISPVLISDWYTTVAYIGGITALTSATMALTSVDIKRVIAFSTISQLGLMFAALGLATQLGWFSSQFHLLSHSVFKALLFLSAGTVIHTLGTNSLDEMGGLRRHMPVTFFTGAVGALALSGIPPFSGFFSKDLIIEASLESGKIPVILLIFLTSIFTVAYSLRWVYRIFFGAESEYVKSHHPHDAPLLMKIPLLVLASITILAGVVNVGGFTESSFLEFTGIEEHFETSLPAFLSSLTIIAIGGVAAYLVYFARILPAERLRSGGIGRALHRFLVNRYYIDAAYYKVFVGGTLWLSAQLRKYAEDKGIDGFNYFVADKVSGFVQIFRNLQTGQSNINISGFILGIALLLLLFLLLIFRV